jgi:uncharacterized protein YbjT (DUF2867 family)
LRIVVAGGTGLLGSEITRHLLDAGYEVAVLSRSGGALNPPDSRALRLQGDVTDPASLEGKLIGADIVVDAVQFPNSPVEDPKKGRTFEQFDLGGTKNLVDASRMQGVSHFIGLSGVGAAEDARFHWLRFKWQEEQHIKQSGLGFTIFRPSWIYGPRDVSLNRFLGFARFLPFVPVIGDGRTRINPLFVNDLAAHVTAVAGDAAALSGIFEIGGPRVLTMDEVVRTALRVAGKRRFLLHQPVGVMKVIASLVQHVPGRPLTPGAIDFITMDGVADTSALVEAFGLLLTPLEEGLASYLARRADTVD